MGYIINPMEVRVWIQEVQGWLGDMEERYQSGFDVIKEFAENENLEGNSYNKMKEDFMAYHQLAVHGAGEAKLSIESDLTVLEEAIGTEYLDEDVLDEQIDRQEEICRNYEQVLDRLALLAIVPLLEYYLEPIIESNRKLLELSEKVLETLREKQERIYKIDNETMRLFSSASDLFSLISAAISDLQVCVTGKGRMSDGSWKNVLISSFEEKSGILTELKSKVFITKNQLISCGWDSGSINDEMLEELNRVLVKYDINSPDKINHFIAQCMYESGKGLYTVEQGSEAYFTNKAYGSKYRGVGYIQMTWEYSYKAFATYLPLQEYPELLSYSTYKSPNNNGAETIDKEYQKLLGGAKELGVNIDQYTDIVDVGYLYVSNNFAWECAGYDWTVKKLNEAIDNGATVDDVSRKINKYDKSTFSKRKALYDEIIRKNVFK